MRTPTVLGFLLLTTLAGCGQVASPDGSRPKPPDQGQPPAVEPPKQDGPKPTPKEDEKVDPADYKELTDKGVVVDGVRFLPGQVTESTEKDGKKTLRIWINVEATKGGSGFTLRGWDRSQISTDPMTGDTKYGDVAKAMRMQWTKCTTDTGERLELIHRTVASSVPQESFEPFKDFEVSNKVVGSVRFSVSRPASQSKWLLLSLPPSEFSTLDRVKIKIPYEPRAAGS